MFSEPTPPPAPLERHQQTHDMLETVAEVVIAATGVLLLAAYAAHSTSKNANTIVLAAVVLLIAVLSLRFNNPEVPVQNTVLMVSVVVATVSYIAYQLVA